MGLEFQVSPFDPRAYFISRKSGGAAGDIATHTDDILRCGEPDISRNVRSFPEHRSGDLDVREQSVAYVGMEARQSNDFSAQLTQGEFTKGQRPITKSPESWAARQRALSLEEMKVRQCKLGELCWSATVSRPDIFARPGRIVARVNSLRAVTPSVLTIW